jgi:N6-L-threonylcarbamoyladenine synthase
MLLLAIETSCDETAAAVVKDGRKIMSSVVSSQIKIHAEYGGVVPEIASRKHLEMISPVIAQALSEASVKLAAIEGIAVTRGPGLLGALLVGVSTAKAMAAALGIPFVGVHHIEGHLLAPFLEHENVGFPFLALVVSGGHTHLYQVEGIGRYRTLGKTVDDAVGEAFDKSANIMGLEYPGGARVDALAKEGDDAAVRLPRPMINDGTLNFSFSGLKTAVLQHVAKHPVTMPSQQLNDICASLQAAICEVLSFKTEAALLQTGARRLVLAGGVACNSGLRNSMAKLASRLDLELFIPSPALCGDNAAMLAVPGNYYLENGMASSSSIDAVASWQLDMAGETWL